MTDRLSGNGGGASEPAAKRDLSRFGRVVLVFQGGGALGAYQVGVYEALRETGVEPDWVIGTSIGAINASLIAGSKVGERLDRLKAFWRRIERGGADGFGRLFAAPASAGAVAGNWSTLTTGLSGFFAPNPLAFVSPFAALGEEAAAYYSTAPLRRTLSELIDEQNLNAGAPRVTVGAADVATGEMRYFDSRDERLGLAHIMASGALPPAFPAVRVGERLFWDGGILSNTPVEAVFDDNPRVSSLIFSVHIWNPHGPDPRSIWEVMSRQKDIQYASRTKSHIERQKQLHRLRHIIAELADKLPEEKLNDARVRLLKSYGCVTRMHVVRLVAAPLPGEDHTKDIDFSREGVAERRRAGREDTLRVLERQPWNAEFDPMEGFILHEVDRGEWVKSN